MALTTARKTDEPARRPAMIVVILTALCFLLALASVMLWATLRHQRSVDSLVSDLACDEFIWGDFLTGSNPTLLVFPDVFTFKSVDPATDRSRLHYDSRITSIDELRMLLSPDVAQLQADEGYLLASESLYDLYAILPIYTKLDRPVRLQLASKMNRMLLRDNNIMFIGQFSGLRSLHPFFPQHPFRVSNRGTGCSIEDAVTRTTYTPMREGDRVTDYAIVYKIPGAEESILLYVVSFLDLGSHEIVRKIARLRSLNELQDRIVRQFGPIPEYYGLMMRVQGFEKTVVHSEIVAIHAVEDSVSERSMP